MSFRLRRDSLLELEAQLVALIEEKENEEAELCNEGHKDDAAPCLLTLVDESETQVDYDDEDADLWDDCDDDSSVVTTDSQAFLRLSQARCSAQKALELELALMSESSRNSDNSTSAR